MRYLAILAAIVLGLTAAASAHDIPNARVDRSIQATVHPGRLTIDYEVSLSELTLTQDLRSLIGSLPGADRHQWFERYGEVVGPLNAKGLLVSVNRVPVVLGVRGFDLVVEDHPRFTFHFTADLGPSGRLTIQDTNYAASEGTSRLAIRGVEGVEVRGDDLPSEVTKIAIRAVWELTDVEERRTRQVEVSYRLPTKPMPLSLAAGPVPTAKAVRSADRLSRLLDRASGVSLFGLALLAFGLGAAHAIQPGHGKTLVAATVVGEGGHRLRGTLLAIVATLTHTGSVMLVAVGLWLTRSSRYGSIHVSLAHVAGFLIAAIGLWRLGRHLGGYGEHEGEEVDPAAIGTRGVIGLGIAAGLVPCWDAVGLIVLAEAVGRLALGMALLVSFGLGMAVVLVAIGWLAARFRRLIARHQGEGVWERRLGLGSGLVLSAVGVYLLIV